MCIRDRLYYLAVLLDFERYGVLAIIFGLVLLMFVYVFTYPTYEATWPTKSAMRSGAGFPLSMTTSAMSTSCFSMATPSRSRARPLAAPLADRVAGRVADSKSRGIRREALGRRAGRAAAAGAKAAPCSKCRRGRRPHEQRPCARARRRQMRGGPAWQRERQGDHGCRR